MRLKAVPCILWFLIAVSAEGADYQFNRLDTILIDQIQMDRDHSLVEILEFIRLKGSTSKRVPPIFAMDTIRFQYSFRANKSFVQRKLVVRETSIRNALKLALKRL